MIELTLIIFHILLITSVFSINPLVFNKKLLYQNKNTLAQNISLNFLITANIVLVLSFFNLIIKFFMIPKSDLAEENMASFISNYILNFE